MCYLYMTSRPTEGPSDGSAAYTSQGEELVINNSLDTALFYYNYRLHMALQ